MPVQFPFEERQEVEHEMEMDDRPESRSRFLKRLGTTLLVGLGVDDVLQVELQVMPFRHRRVLVRGEQLLRLRRERMLRLQPGRRAMQRPSAARAAEGRQGSRERREPVQGSRRLGLNRAVCTSGRSSPASTPAGR